MSPTPDPDRSRRRAAGDQWSDARRQYQERHLELLRSAAASDPEPWAERPTPIDPHPLIRAVLIGVAGLALLRVALALAGM